jgi:hypothetical protein
MHWLYAPHSRRASLKMNAMPAIADSCSITSKYEFEIPAEAIKNGQLSFYIWNFKKEDFYITDASIELFEIPKEIFVR